MPAVERGPKRREHIAIRLGHIGESPPHDGTRVADLAPGHCQEKAEAAHPFQPELQGRHGQVGRHLVVHPPIAGMSHPFQHAPPLQHARLRADAGLAGTEIGGELVERERVFAQQQPPEDPPRGPGEPFGFEEDPDLLDELAAPDAARMQESLRPVMRGSLDSFSPFRQY
jgi:hypothetical protein